jgi:hypothetical protein
MADETKIDDSVRLAALRALVQAAAAPCAPQLLDESLRQRIDSLLRRGATADAIADELDLPIDVVMPILWRIAQAA